MSERDRNKLNDHDLLVRIDERVEFLAETLHKHVVEDEEEFKIIKERTSRLERGYWIFVGAVVVLDAVIRWLG